VTRAWANHLLGFEPVEIKDLVNNYDLFVVTNVDNTWVQDGTRVCSQYETRKYFQNFIIKEINRASKEMILLPKDYEHAFNTLKDLLNTIC